MFDWDLILSRLAQRPDPDQSNFLTEEISSEIIDRLKLTLRQFACIAVIGDCPKSLHDYLSTRPGTDELHHIGLNEISFNEQGCLLPVKAEKWDAVIVIMALEAIEDMVGALIQIRRALRPDGLMLASLLGAGSLEELRQSWLVAEMDVTGGASPRVAPFAEIRDMGAVLQRAGFALPVVDRSAITVRYETAMAVMRDVKDLGYANALSARSRRPVTAKLLKHACNYYQTRFADADGRVRMSLNLLYLTGWAPDQSQQQPLAPGSAKTRLADALKTTEIPLKEI